MNTEEKKSGNPFNQENHGSDIYGTNTPNFFFIKRTAYSKYDTIFL